MRRFAVNSIGTAIAVLCGSSAFAQSATAPTSTQPQAAASGELQEIIVTAQKRNESLQSVPIAISVVSAAELSRAGLSDTSDLNAMIPGLNIQTYGTYSYPEIRGVSTTASELGQEPNIATYVDGAYYPAAFALLYEFNNIDHVEVLKGPQGTLFGRNATGGAISIVTREPSFKPTADLSVSYGRFNEETVTAYGSTGLSDSLAVDLAVLQRYRDPYIYDPVINKSAGAIRLFAFRSKLLFKPNDRAKITLSLDYSTDQDNAQTSQYSLGGDNASKAIAALFGKTATVCSTYRTYCGSRIPVDTITALGAALNAEFDFDYFDIISVTNARRTRASDLLDNDNSSYDYNFLNYGPYSRILNEDLRIQSPANTKVIWTAGLNVYRAEDTFNPFDFQYIPFGILDNEVAETKTFSMAGYGQATVPILDSLLLTAGGRFTFERKSADWYATGLGIPYTTVEKTWHDFSPRVTLEYKFSPTSQVYATFSQGWKSGEINAGSFQTTPIDPEKLKAYELGLKSDVTNSIRANIEGFYYDYKDIQVQILTSGGTALAQNAAAATMFGVDADLTFAFHDLFQAGDRLVNKDALSYNHAYYDSFPAANGYTPIVSPTLGLIGNKPETINAAGNPLVASPRYTVGSDFSYSRDYTFGTITGDLDVYYNSGSSSDAQNTEAIREHAYTKLNLSLGWTSTDGHYGVAAWGKNVTNAITHGIVLINGTNTPVMSSLPPTFGGTFTYHF